jgi:branched-chain amino acid transport system permease protein
VERFMTSQPQSLILNRYKLRPAELLLWVLPIIAFVLFPKSLALGTMVLVFALFALSFDLLLGFAGIMSLGHAAFFGIGAYTAGLIALGGWNEAITGVLASALLCALVAAAVGPFLLRLTGLPLVMVTVGIASILFELANKMSWLTGGDDGLYGIRMSPLFGLFPFSITGGTKFFYAYGWLLLSFLVIRRLVSSPFGVALQGIRENPVRMRLIGNPVLPHLVIAFVTSAAFAGIAGAVWAQTGGFVGLGALSLDTSIDAIVMLVLGGLGSLYGALIGAPFYIIFKHFAQQLNPHYWMFLVGGMLIFIVRFTRGGILGILKAASNRLVMRRLK